MEYSEVLHRWAPEARIVHEALEWEDYDVTADLVFDSDDPYCYALIYFYLQSNTACVNHHPPDGYVLTLKAQQNVVELTHRVGGVVQSVVASTPYTISPEVPYHVEIKLDAPDIDVHVNGQQVIQVEHTGYSSGTIGFGGHTGGGIGTHIDWYCDNINARPTSGLSEEIPPAVSAIGLKCSPNPTSMGLSIEFSTPRDASARVEVYSIDGALVKTLRRYVVDLGRVVLNWDGRNENGCPSAAGVYFVKVAWRGGSEATRVILLR